MKTYPQHIQSMLNSGSQKIARLFQLDLVEPLAYTDAGFDIEPEIIATAEIGLSGAISILINGDIAGEDLDNYVSGGRIYFEGVEPIFKVRKIESFTVASSYGFDGIRIHLATETPLSVTVPEGTRAYLSARPQTLKYSRGSTMDGFEGLSSVSGRNINEVPFSASQADKELVSSLQNGGEAKRKVRLLRVYLDNNNQPMKRLYLSGYERVYTGESYASGAQMIRYMGRPAALSNWLSQGSLIKFSNHHTVYEVDSVIGGQDGYITLATYLTVGIDDSVSIIPISTPLVDKIYEGSGSHRAMDDSNSSVTITTSSRWSEFERLGGRRTTPNSQKAVYPDDDCFIYSNKAQETEYWAGKTRSK